MNPLLQVNHLSYAYHSVSSETYALSDLSFQVREGEFIAIVGPSGCGNPMVGLWKQFPLRQPLPGFFTRQNGCHR